MGNFQEVYGEEGEEIFEAYCNANPTLKKCPGAPRKKKRKFVFNTENPGFIAKQLKMI